MQIEPGSITDFLTGALLMMGMAFMVNIFVSFVLSKIIALKFLPDRRAFWTVLPGYIAALGISIPLMSDLGYLTLAPVIAAPSGLILYWWYRTEFRKSWVDDVENLPENVTLQNDDWKIGLAGICLLVLFGIFRLFFKMMGS